MKLALIVAVADNGVIGQQGLLPWRLPDDMRWFRANTEGHHVIMGRTTWESLGRPLANRTNVVLSRRAGHTIDGAEVAQSLDAALDLARGRGDDEAFVIGGGSVYREALPRANRIYLTRVLASFPGDVTFPPLPPDRFVETFREHHDPDDRHAVPFVFTILERS